MTNMNSPADPVIRGHLPSIDATSVGVSPSRRTPNSEKDGSMMYSGVTAWSQKALARFEAGRDDILIVDRPAPEVDVVEISVGRVHHYRSSITRQSIGAHVKLGLAEIGIECRVLKDDIIELADSFLNQFHQRVANLRIELVDRQSCPKFHCDNLNIRLVTTYSGRSTEYQFVGDESIYAAPLYGLVFLKGHKHQTHSDRVLHRSPEVTPGTKRVFVVLDF